MKPFIFTISLLLIILNSFGQPQLDSSSFKNKTTCGTSVSNITYYNDVAHRRVQPNPGDVNTLIMPFPPGGMMTCGRFVLYFDDFFTSTGFFDPTSGLNRRNTFCAVVTYVQSVLSMQNVISQNEFIDVHVLASYTPTNPAPPLSSALAEAGPIYPAIYSPSSSSTAGIFNGYAYDHIVTGIDPDISNFDMNVRVNFHQTWDPQLLVYDPVVYWDDYLNTSTRCAHDLYSILLHEVTHGLGWVSNINEDASLNIKSAHNNGVNNNNQFTLFDQTFLYYNNAGNNLNSPANFDKLIIAGPAINPTVNTNPTPIRTNRIWMYDNDRPLNQPVYSGNYFAQTSWPAPVAVSSLLSHLNEQVSSFTFTQRISPGFSPHYPMAPFAHVGEQKREWTMQEVRALVQLGYTLDPGYPNLAIVGNTPATFVAGQYTEFAGAGTANANFPEGAFLNSFTLANNSSGVSIVLPVSTNANLTDADSDPITVDATSLYNIRGCGIGGNNTACLQIINGGNDILYTPRTDFYGRAQFGFYLTDGNERGSFVVYTIDVTRAPGFTNTPANELVLNGGYEEGTEVKQIGANEFLPNSDFDFGLEGKFCTGFHLSDSHPYEHYSLATTPFGGGDVIFNSSSRCDIPTLNNAISYPGSFGDSFHTWPSVFAAHYPNSAAIPGTERFRKMEPLFSYFSLADDVTHCTPYILEFDIAPFNSLSPIGGTFNFTVSFTNSPSLTPTWNYSTVLSTNLTSSPTWQHVVIMFTYCGTNPSQYMNFSSPNKIGFIDNVSLRVNTSPPPLVVNAGPDQNICIGQSATLTGSASNIFCTPTYQWTPGGATTTSTTVTPAVTTIYTFTVNDGCRISNDQVTVTVNPLPAISVTPSSPTICNGSCVGLTASGASTYSWSPGTGLSCTNCANPNACPTTTTTYNVTGTDANGCQSSTSVTVTVNPVPFVQVSPPNPTICVGGCVALTAAGATSYLWSPGTGLSCTTCSNPNACPTSTTMYTVTGTTGGCSSTGTTTVNVISACAPAGATTIYNTPTTLPTGTTLTGTYAFNANITIAGTVNFTGADISVFTGVKIIVPPGATLNIDNTYLHACTGCGGGMWHGIEVDNGGTLNLNQQNPAVNRSALTDATNAIITKNGITPTAPILHIEGTLFNVNNTSIKVLPHFGDFTFNFIRNCIFTGRNVTISVGTIGTDFLTLKNALINNTGIPPGQAIITGGRPKRAIDVDSKTGSFPLYVGDPGTAGYINVFDNHDYGVYAFNSWVTIRNNKFMNFQSGPVFAGMPFTGIPIYSPSTATTHTITIGGVNPNEPNLFTQFLRAVEINKGHTVNIRFNVFTNTTTSSPITTGAIGMDGVYLRDVNTNINVTDNNQFTNCGSSIYIIRNNSLGAINPTTISVQGNTITASGTGTVGNGIRLHDVAGNSVTGVNNITIESNAISNVNRGVLVSNIKNRARVFQNSINVAYGSGLRDGIKVEGSDLAEVKNNTINTSQTNPTNTNLRGIYVIQSINNRIYCNTITQTGEGMTFEGTCNSAFTPLPANDRGIRSNSVIDCNRGFVLRTNGVVMNQGNATNPAFKHTPPLVLSFSGTFPGGHTFTENTANANTASPLFGLSGWISATNHLSTPVSQQYTFASGGLNNATGTPLSCPAAFLLSVPNTGVADKEEENRTNEYSDQLAAINSVNNEYPVFNEETKWLQLQFAFSEIKENPDLTKNPILNKLYQDNLLSGIGKIWTINDLIQKGEYTEANRVNNSIVATKIPEDNHQLFNFLYLQQYIIPDYVYTEKDMNDLYSIADQCPLRGGNAVFQARNMIMYLLNQSVDFEDKCDEEMAAQSSLNEVAAEFKVWLYPNPNDGNMIIEYKLDNDGEVVITDMSGREVCRYILKAERQRMEINCDKLVDGPYFYRIFSNGESIDAGKFIVIK